VGENTPLIARTAATTTIATTIVVTIHVMMIMIGITKIGDVWR
jgi:hypothetical protein